jgi:hypothetical protein
VSWRPFQTLPPTADQITAWWTQWPDANIGLVTGSASGLVVVDLDGDGAEASFAERCGGQLPETPRVRTARGWHLYFAHPADGIRVPTRAGVLPGVDVRGDGGFAIAPPSVHASGSPYAFERDMVSLPPCPSWLYAEAEGSTTMPTAESIATPSPSIPSSGLATLTSGVPEGYRDSTAAQIAGIYFDRGLTADEVLTMLRGWNTLNSPPLEDDQLQKVVDSISRADHQNHPERWEASFQPVAADQLLATPPEPVTWQWEPFLPAGSLSVLAGFAKSGKSTLVYPLAVAVAQGRRFLGYPTRQGAVLLLAVEEHDRDVRRRLERFGMQPSDPIHVHCGPLANDPRQIASVRAFCRMRDIRLVVLDTLAHFWHVENENDNAAVLRAVKPLLQLARTTGTAVLLVHHDRKTGGQGGRSIRGGSAVLGVVDQALLLAEADGDRRILKSVGRYAETPRRLLIELRGNEYHTVEHPTAQALAHDAGEVWALLPETGGKDQDTLVQEAGISKKRVLAALDVLGSSVSRTGDGKKRSPYRYCRAAPDPGFGFVAPPRDLAARHESSDAEHYRKPNGEEELVTPLPSLPLAQCVSQPEIPGGEPNSRILEPVGWGELS